MKAEEAILIAAGIGAAAYVVAKSSEGGKGGGGGGVIPIPIEVPGAPQGLLPDIDIKFPDFRVNFPKIEFSGLSYPTFTPDFGQLMLIEGVRQQVEELKNSIENKVKGAQKPIGLDFDGYFARFSKAFTGSIAEKANIPPPEKAGRGVAEGFMNLFKAISIWMPGGRILDPKTLEPVGGTSPLDKAVKSAVRGAAGYVGATLHSAAENLKKVLEKEKKPSELYTKTGIAGLKRLL
ncbi:hypothetical protein [Geoglobus ahangari]